MLDSAVWLAFGALLFFFMGLGLLLEPDAYAQSAADWAKETGAPAAEARRLTRALCRFCGALFLGVSAWFAVGGPAERLRALDLSSRQVLAAGGASTLVSLLLSAVKMTEWSRPKAATLRGRAAFWSGWAVVFTLMAFGAFLVSRCGLL
jgi:hypothetical protein